MESCITGTKRRILAAPGGLPPARHAREASLWRRPFLLVCEDKRALRTAASADLREDGVKQSERGEEEGKHPIIRLLKLVFQSESRSNVDLICYWPHDSSIYTKSLFTMSFHTSVERLLLGCLQPFIHLDIQRNGQSIILMDPCSRRQNRREKKCLAEGEKMMAVSSHHKSP